MIWIWMALGAIAGADPTAATAEEEVRSGLVDLDASQPRKRVRLPPTRVETRVAIRQQSAAAAGLLLGFQVVRTRRAALELGVTYYAGRPLRIPGPPRTFQAWDLAARYPISATRWLAIGPVGGISHRPFRQQFTPINAIFTPFGGVGTETTLIHARKWGLILEVGATIDLSVTRMVIETAEVQNLSPIEGQVGLRWNFGHGVVPEPGSGR